MANISQELDSNCQELDRNDQEDIVRRLKKVNELLFTSPAEEVSKHVYHLLRVASKETSPGGLFGPDPMSDYSDI